MQLVEVVNKINHVLEGMEAEGKIDYQIVIRALCSHLIMSLDYLNVPSSDVHDLLMCVEESYDSLHAIQRIGNYE